VTFRLFRAKHYSFHETIQIVSTQNQKRGYEIWKVKSEKRKISYSLRRTWNLQKKKLTKNWKGGFIWSLKGFDLWSLDHNIHTWCIWSDLLLLRRAAIVFFIVTACSDHRLLLPLTHAFLSLSSTIDHSLSLEQSNRTDWF